ncbi:hypothetical protein ABXJ56_15365 [Microbacterium chocolatum]|uniref:hypothetical protein n=1 Tax=Microbacterium aurantiacum TaxID=162393 RepID=UPI00338D6508
MAVGSAALLVLGLISAGGSGAVAATGDIFDPDVILGQVEDKLAQAPAIDIDQSELTVSPIQGADRRGVGSEVEGLKVSSSASESMTSAAAETGARISDGIQISASFATEVVARTSDTIVAETIHDNLALYVQPTAGGVRLMTVLADREGPSTFTYDFSVPDGTTAKSGRDGGLNLLDSEGRSVGSIRAPWAQDANGRELSTAYEWRDGALTQRVDLSDPSIVFPVVADPAWDYTVGWLIETKTVSTVRSMLYDCFNCYFPVAGAPAAFPTYNQFLPLEVGPIPGVLGWNFNCYMDGTSYYNEGGGMAWFSYWFRAAASHVDGAGSTITFNFNPAWNPSNPSKKFTELVVYAYIMNENPMGIGQPAYTAGAWYNWGAFAGNLRTG